MDEAIIVDGEPEYTAGKSQAEVLRESNPNPTATRIRVISRSAKGSGSGSGSPAPTQSSGTTATISISKKPIIKGSGNAAAAPKLKVKLGGKAGPPANTSFLGPYDRELDSDDEELAFEEQFILRVPEGDDCDTLRKMVQARDVKDDVWFKFTDSRRGVFHIGDSTYSTKLVDLPCIIESEKTLDNRHMFKVADICQMLVVGQKVDTESASALENRAPFNINDFIWPHGITPPLKHVRKRRFRKRVNRNTIETTEQEVERLLEEDAKADEVKWEILENVDPDLSDSEFDNEAQYVETPGLYGSEGGGTPLPDDFDEGEDENGGGEQGGETPGDEDDELFGFGAELEAEMARAMEEGSDEDDDEDDENVQVTKAENEDTSDEDDDEDEEVVQARKLLEGEIEDLRAAIEKKESEILGAMNPLIKRRFEDSLKKLRIDFESKVAQRQALSERKYAEDAERARLDAGEDEDEDEEDEEEDEEEDGDEEGEVIEAQPASSDHPVQLGVKAPSDAMEVD